MELQLSSIDGFKVFFQLQSSAASPRFIIFAGLRSGRSHIYLRIARQLGAEATLYMPFTAEQLHAAVHNVLSESEEATFLSHALVGSPVG
jgi:DNA-binding response OmpR family regulator